MFFFESIPWQTIIMGLVVLTGLILVIYHVSKIVKSKRNPIKEEIYSDLKSFKQIVEKINKKLALTSVLPNASRMLKAF